MGLGVKSFAVLQEISIYQRTIEPYLMVQVINNFSTKHLLSFRNSLKILQIYTDLQ